MTTIYLMRHGDPMKVEKGILDISEGIQLSNVKNPLSVDGEHHAERRSMESEFSNIDVIWSSSYVRALSTAKYFAYKNGIKINITDRLGEREFGVNSWDELPEGFERKQYLDENYKIGNGESQKDVRERMTSVFNDIVKDNKDKRVLIVSHATAISYLLKNWCSIELLDDKLLYKFNENVILNGYFNYCETFKISIEDNKIVNIENIKEEV